MTNDVVVTGLGLVTPAGLGVQQNWERVCAGIPTAARDDGLAGLEVDFSCRVPDAFDPETVLDPRRAWRMDRGTCFAVAAAGEAVKDAGLDPATWDGARVGVVIGSTTGGVSTFEQQHQRLLSGKAVSPMFLPATLVNMVAGELAIEFGATGPSLVTATACASGATAIGIARMLLAAGSCDVVLAGGMEACITPSFVSGFARMGALSKSRGDPGAASRPFDRDRDGFVIGEGAAVLILEQARHARARRAPIRAVIAGYAATSDAHHPTCLDPAGVAVERAIRSALADADLRPDQVDHVNAHGTSTPANDKTEATVLSRVIGTEAAVTSTKGVTGHMLSAAGAAEVAYCVLAVEHGLVPPTANLRNQDPQIELDIVRDGARPRRVEVAVSNSSGFGGQNAAVVVTAGMTVRTTRPQPSARPARNLPQ
jgi:3-oxoacyl-[acyl-carrier-protein] synthase II